MDTRASRAEKSHVSVCCCTRPSEFVVYLRTSNVLGCQLPAMTNGSKSPAKTWPVNCPTRWCFISYSDCIHWKQPVKIMLTLFTLLLLSWGPISEAQRNLSRLY